MDVCSSHVHRLLTAPGGGFLPQKRGARARARAFGLGPRGGQAWAGLGGRWELPDGKGRARSPQGAVESRESWESRRCEWVLFPGGNASWANPRLLAVFL